MSISISIVAGNIQFATATNAAPICAVISDGRQSWTTDAAGSEKLRQTLLTPPSTTMSEPVMNELSSEARKRAALAISSGCASLSIGV